MIKYRYSDLLIKLIITFEKNIKGKILEKYVML